MLQKHFWDCSKKSVVVLSTFHCSKMVRSMIATSQGVFDMKDLHDVDASKPTWACSCTSEGATTARFCRVQCDSMNFFFGIGKWKTFYRSCLQSRNQLVTSPRKGLILIAESEEERQQMKHLRHQKIKKHMRSKIFRCQVMIKHDLVLQ